MLTQDELYLPCHLFLSCFFFSPFPDQDFISCIKKFFRENTKIIAHQSVFLALNGYIRFPDLTVRRIFPGGQPHVFFFTICTRHDNFCCCLAGDGPMELVLHGSKELFGDLAGRIIISAALRIDCLLYTSPSPRDRQKSRMPSSA